MGWFDGWFGSSSNDSDPLRRLDPKLREFLERESPVKYTTTSTTDAQQPSQSQQPHQSPTQQQQQQPEQQTPPVPRESLFQDGRYAHLWKTYRPLASVEAETKSDSEKLTDVLEAYKERRAAIGRAALENCAEEQVEWSECMKSGSLRARMTMCRDEVQRFERCYNAQSRLLKALGYLSVAGRDPEVDEDIQMRADELYQRVLAQQREIDRAKEEGREPPVFKPLFENNNTSNLKPGGAAAAAAGDARDPLEPSAATVAAWKEKLEKLPVEEREAEEAALRADYKAKAEMAMKLQGLWQERAKEREARKQKGEETLFDKIKSAVGVGPWSGPKPE